MYLLHDDPTGAHFGTNIMLAKIRQKYYWPGMMKDVETYVRSCYQCQRRGKPQTHNEMHGIIAEAPFERIGIDFVGPLPETNEGNRYILVNAYPFEWCFSYDSMHFVMRLRHHSKG